MSPSEEEFRAVLYGLIAGGLLLFALVATVATIYDRIKAKRDTKSLAETFREWDA